MKRLILALLTCALLALAQIPKPGGNPGGNPSGPGGGAPTTVGFIVTATDGGLSNERVLTPGLGIAFTDGGAKGALTVAADSAQMELKNYGTSTTGNDSYAVTLPADPGAYADGMRALVKADTANTGPASLSLNGRTAKSIVYGNDVAALPDNLIRSGRTHLYAYCSTCQSSSGAWILLGPFGNQATQATRTINLTIDGAGSTITTGIKARVTVPFPCTLSAATMLADQTGSIVIDVWKAAYGSYPPSVANTIVASAPLTISSANKSQDLTLAGWTKSVSAYDTFIFNVNSATSITQVNVVMECQI